MTMPDTPLSLEFRGAFPLDPLQRFAAWAGALQGWRRFAVAFLLGALAAAALPPVDMVPLLFVAFSGLVWLAGGCRRAREGLPSGPGQLPGSRC